MNRKRIRQMNTALLRRLTGRQGPAAGACGEMRC